MSDLWTNDGSGWQTLSPVGFTAEETLHGLIEEAPNLLPLSGAPQIVMLGREVGLSSGYADLMAIEVTGQPVIIEIKLAKNSEARKAVVAQILAYAASIYGLDVDTFETQVLGRHLRKRGFGSIAEVVANEDESGTFQPETFTATLADCLTTGTARLVLVLDAAPTELMRLAGYLEAVSERLTVDLITVSRYEVGEQSVLVPQRVDPGRELEERLGRPGRSVVERAQYVEGATEFVASIENAPEERRESLTQLAEWAQSLERQDLARLMTTVGKYWIGLRVRLLDKGGGPVTLWNLSAESMQIWGSVLKRRAPESLDRVQQVLAPVELKVDASVCPKAVTPELLGALTLAYREAAERTQ